MISFYKSSCPFVGFVPTLSTNHGNYVFNNSDLSFIPLLVLPVLAHPGMELIGYKPQQVSKDIVGNNGCHHDNFTGTCLSLPFNTKDSYGFHLFSQYNDRYTHVIDLNNKCTIHYTQKSTNPTAYDDTLWDIRVSNSEIEFITRTATYRNDGSIFHRTIFRNRIRWELVEKDSSYYILKIWYGQNSSAAYNGKYPLMPPVPPLYTTPSSSVACTASNRRLFKSNALDAKLSLASVLSFASSKLPYNNDRLYWGRLSQDACNVSKVLQQNLIATIKDFKELPLLIESIRSLLAKKVDPKVIADAYLTIKYAILPTIQDSKEIMSAMSHSTSVKKNYCVSRSQYMTTSVVDEMEWETSYNLKMYYLQEDVFWIALLKDAMAIGLFPSLENVWDFVPFSFAIDWFVDFGGLLEDMDTKTYLSTLPIISVIQTKCDRTSFNAASIPFAGSSSAQGLISYSRYRRNLESSLLPPLLELNCPKNPLDHIVEGAALILQRKK